jgi:RHS repeat-associated protein
MMAHIARRPGFSPGPPQRASTVPPVRHARTSNHLTAIAQGAGGTRAFTYDAAGNVTFDNRSGGGYGYTYDAAGRMASLTINGVLHAEYKYDFAGRQAIRKLPQLGVTLHSVFDSDGRRIAEYNEATGALVREYVWLGWSPVAVIEGGVVSFVRSDHIGRPVFATNAAGTKVWTATYTPFGGVRTTTGTPITARFPGQWFQSESGLHQNWMRDYDPTTGRYIEADPLGLVAGASVYGYANQSPLMYTDPNGENPLLIGAAIGFGIGFLLDAAGQLYDNGGRLDCVNWWQASLSGGIGAVTGGGLGAAFRYSGVISKTASAAVRPTYSIGRTNPFLKRLGVRFESHPIRRSWPNWASYPHWHAPFNPKRHLPLVEPLAALATIFLTPELGCGCQE